MTDEIERLVALAEKLDLGGAKYELRTRWEAATGGTTCEVMRCVLVATHYRAGPEQDHSLGVAIMRQVLKGLLDEIDFGYQNRIAAISDAERAIAESSAEMVKYEESLPSVEVRSEAQTEVNKMEEMEETMGLSQVGGDD